MNAHLLMKRRAWLRLASASTLLASASPMSWAQANTPRLISLGGGMTEVIYRLGAERWLVATDTTSVFPEAALHTPKVGYMRALSAEGVLSLRPTAVLGTHEVGPPAVLDQLRDAGVALQLVQADHSFEELLAKVQAAAQASQRLAQGEALVAELKQQWRAVQQRVQKAPTSKAPRVLFVMAHGGKAQVAGRATAAHAMLAFAGARNPLAESSGYKSLTPEAAATALPDVILTTAESIQASSGTDRFWEHPGLAFTPAGRAKRLVVMDMQFLLGFGPRLPAAVASLAQQLGTVPA
ncbi:heme/hemin ABC transporter substrate-binding protein [Aquabacterium sp.]|uniref:heme/hemin ABC transporter substrate-binding protein n=1 Tax=Aquabacterium sp. TaxID=1872578 RepID=UPI003D6D2950